MGCCSTEIGPTQLSFTWFYAIYHLGPHAGAYSVSRSFKACFRAHRPRRTYSNPSFLRVFFGGGLGCNDSGVKFRHLVRVL